MKKEVDHKLNVLIAYPYLKPDVIELLHENISDIRFVLDSGAFTAWKSGNPIELDDYCKFVESLPFTPWRYFTLDKIGDPEGTIENYELMLKRGLRPLPIFTRGEDPSVIDRFYETSDVVGIGGIVGTKGNKGFVKGIMEHVGDRKVHWLGFTNQRYVGYYNPYMCDSSSWSGGVRYGRLDLYMGKGKWVGLSKQDFRTKPPQHIIDRIKFYGEDPRKLAYNKEWVNSGKPLLALIPMKSWIHYSFQIRKNFGTQMFLAIASKTDLTNFLKCYHELRDLKII